MFKLFGEFDLVGARELESAVALALPDEPGELIADLSSLSFIDSSGMRGVVRAAHLVEQVGVKMVIVPGPPRIHRLFELAGLSKVLPFVQ